jgi:hypothetical protein
MKLQVSALGLACGLLWAIFLVLISLAVMFTPYWSADAVSWIGNFYLGYDITIGGIVIGAIWAFVDAFIGGALLAWLYNMFAK